MTRNYVFVFLQIQKYFTSHCGRHVTGLSPSGTALQKTSNRLNVFTSMCERTKELRRWCMTQRATEHPPRKQGVIYNFSSVSCIFHGPLKPSHIQFKCKATKEEVFVFAIYSTSASAITELWPDLSTRVYCSTDHSDHSTACHRLIDTLDLYLIRMDHSFALVPPFRFFALFFSCCRLCSLLWLNCAPKGNLNLFLWSVILFKLTLNDWN